MKAPAYKQGPGRVSGYCVMYCRVKQQNTGQRPEFIQVHGNFLYFPFKGGLRCPDFFGREHPWIRCEGAR